MKKYPAFLFTVLALTLSVAHAEEHQGYSRNVLDKAGNGFANIITAPLEIPKNMINTANQSNAIYGIFGGIIKGTVHMAGRMGVGVADLITAPIPTKSIVYPVLIWDDFDVDTQYTDVFRLSDE